MITIITARHLIKRVKQREAICGKAWLNDQDALSAFLAVALDCGLAILICAVWP